MLNLTQLNYFKLVAQTKNFAAAAKMAHITQPALSNSIRTLEEKIGHESCVSQLLTDPTGREMKVTMQLLISPDGSPAYHVVVLLTSEANARNQLHRID